jgi:alkanesulfonate monooxygenase SsuD/methylene tetrahydromethanopterin reductase-like flavin-dependent oxidoreductase (luciferase family)
MSRLAYVADGSLPLEVLISLARACEESKYESFFLTEGNTKDAFATLSALGTKTTTIGLGTAVALIYSRTPTMIAMSSAAVDEATKKRLILGLGVGRGARSSPGFNASIENMYGVPFKMPLASMRDYINIVRQILKGNAVNYQGEAYSLGGFKFNFPSVRTDIPIYMAAQGPKMIALAGEIANGILFSKVSPEYITGVMPQLVNGAKIVGRDSNEVDLGCLILTAPEWSQEATYRVWEAIAHMCATSHYQKMFEQLGFSKESQLIAQLVNAGDIQKAIDSTPQELVESVSLIGDPKFWPKRLDDYKKVGISLLVLRPMTNLIESLRLIKETSDIF